MRTYMGMTETRTDDGMWLSTIVFSDEDGTVHRMTYPPSPRRAWHPSQEHLDGLPASPLDLTRFLPAYQDLWTKWDGDNTDPTVFIKKADLQHEESYAMERRTRDLHVSEAIRGAPHRNIVQYLGCGVRHDGLVETLVYRRLHRTLQDVVEDFWVDLGYDIDIFRGRMLPRAVRATSRPLVTGNPSPKVADTGTPSGEREAQAASPVDGSSIPHPEPTATDPEAPPPEPKLAAPTTDPIIPATDSAPRAKLTLPHAGVPRVTKDGIPFDVKTVMRDIQAGYAHLRSLGYSYVDISPNNIMWAWDDEVVATPPHSQPATTSEPATSHSTVTGLGLATPRSGRWCLIDFDSCCPPDQIFDKSLGTAGFCGLKGGTAAELHDAALDNLHRWLKTGKKAPLHFKPSEQSRARDAKSPNHTVCTSFTFCL